MHLKIRCNPEISKSFPSWKEPFGCKWYVQPFDLYFSEQGTLQSKGNVISNMEQENIFPNTVFSFRGRRAKIPHPYIRNYFHQASHNYCNNSHTRHQLLGVSVSSGFRTNFPGATGFL